MKLKKLPKKNTIDRHLYEFYFAMEVLRRRYPRAARKKRVIKKWLARCGNDIDFKILGYKEHPFLIRLSKDTGPDYFEVFYNRGE